jgi:DNA repair protein RecN (Recombination protein N)
MLQKLIIKNYAIIDNLTIEPDQHLNTVTGETGAGKSIILGALSLILGERADTSVLINKDEKCFVEAHFEVAGNRTFLKALVAEELDEDSICIIRREINANGKTRAFVNDSPVTLNVLNRLTTLLVDLHQQFGHLALEDDHFQMDVIDAIAKTGDNYSAYKKLHKTYRNIDEQLMDLRSRQLEWQKAADYKQFLYDELADIALQKDEIEGAELHLKQLSHAERIIRVLQTSRASLEDGELPIVNELRKVTQQLQTIGEVMPDVESLEMRISSAYAELKDISAELEALEQKVSVDPALMDHLRERLDLGYKLCKKHGVNTTEDLLKIQSQLQDELQETLTLNDQIIELSLAKDRVHTDLITEAEALSTKRCKVIPEIIKKVNQLLHLVGMPNAHFKIDMRTLAEPSTTGLDKAEFLLDSNKSGQFLPVYKAASGGEMSRIMLCVKSLTAKAMHLPTLIFDEVDAGISGEAAKQVGNLLQELAKFHQIICITHQPQVAARGSRHFYVFKQPDSSKRISTKVRILDQEERVLAIAQMIGGEKPGDAALQHAKEMVAL